MKTLDQIAAELQGYDPQALSANAVNEFLSHMVEPVQQTERVGILDALGRVLAEDLVSPLNVPPHDNSAMDGFAFAGGQLSQGKALRLKQVGTAFAGAAWRGHVGAGECLKVMTGAVLPGGLDTVVPQELVQTSAGEGDTSITIPVDLLSAGDNRRLMGEDIQQGQAALHKGCVLTPAALGLVASLGIAEVTVFRRLRVAYFSTGNEILSLGEPPREGAVYDSNRYTVFGLLTRLDVTLIDLGVVKDEPALLEAAFTRAAREADAIITSGGVSVGEADHTKAMMHKLAGGTHEGNGGVAFWRIAMRPGRPMAVGRITKPDSGGAAVLFGLPGNPVAVMVTFLAFVRPALLQMMGATPKPQPYLRAVSVEPIRKKPGRTEYQRGIVSTAQDGTLQVRITGNQGSGVLSSMAQASGLIVLHHGQANVVAGELVDVMMFSGAI
jgi:molybdopterin molybdotransferase